MKAFLLSEGDKILYGLTLVLSALQQTGVIPVTFVPLVTVALGLLHTVVVPPQPTPDVSSVTRAGAAEVTKTEAGK
jgi:hypothetical protein